MTDVGELTVKIKADAGQLEREMKRANGIVKSSAGEMGTSLGAAGRAFAGLIPVLSTAALISFGKHAVDAAGHINDLAGRIGFAASTLSALETPLVQNGSNLDEFSASINLMNNQLGEAAKGNEEAVKAFDALGLSVERLKKLSPEEQFYEVTKALGQMKDQFAQTEAGRNIFGRGFSTMLPLLKQYEGDMRKAVAAQEDLNNGLSQETIDRIDRFGDALSEAAIKARNAFLELFGALLKVIETVPQVEQLADDTASRYDLGGGSPTSGNSKFGVTPTNGPHTNYPLEEASKGGSAKGGNSALLGAKDAAASLKARAKAAQDAKDALEDYNRSLHEEGVLLGLSERDAAAQEARFKVEEIARKGNVALTREEIEANALLAAKNYDLKQAQDEVNKSIQEAARFQQVLHDKLSSTLTDIASKAGSAKEAMLSFAQSIAEAAFQKQIAGPLADALIGSNGKSGLLDGAISFAGSQLGGFFADGGSPPVGVPSIVGEGGPEIFVPNTAGTIIPNHAMGGTQVTVTQTIVVNAGVMEAVRQQVAAAAPVIRQSAIDGVFTAIQKGGSATKLVGKR